MNLVVFQKLSSECHFSKIDFMNHISIENIFINITSYYLIFSKIISQYIYVYNI